VRYVGWGGLPQVFRCQLARVVSRSRFETIQTSDGRGTHIRPRLDTQAPTTTSPVIVRGMYAALARFGFTDGRFLEPACGLGHFIG